MEKKPRTLTPDEMSRLEIRKEMYDSVWERSCALGDMSRLSREDEQELVEGSEVMTICRHNWPITRCVRCRLRGGQVEPEELDFDFEK